MMLISMQNISEETWHQITDEWHDIKYCCSRVKSLTSSAGAFIGAGVGSSVGATVGNPVVFWLGVSVGLLDGWAVGLRIGFVVGWTIGLWLGGGIVWLVVGPPVGMKVVVSWSLYLISPYLRFGYNIFTVRVWYCILLAIIHYGLTIASYRHILRNWKDRKLLAVELPGTKSSLVHFPGLMLSAGKWVLHWVVMIGSK